MVFILSVFWFVFGFIILINIVLLGDNVVVIVLVVCNLFKC